MTAAPDGPIRHPGGPPPLVGRAREQALLREHLDAALAGRGSLVLIGGEAGIGKTALAEGLCQEAAGQGALVLVGRCYDLSETPPYGPWAEALAHANDADGPPDLAGGAGAASQAALFAGVRDFLAALAARRPLVVLLDDLHWADPASRDLLRALARQLGAVPLLLLVTYRADELTRRHPLYALLPTLVREARAERLDLRPLGDDGLRALVAGRYALAEADAARLVAYLRERAEGNAFYTGEVLRALAEAGALRQDGAEWVLGDLAGVGVPSLLRQVIDARLDRLGEEARALLATAAVVGQMVPLDLWRAVAGADEQALLDTLERAVEARLLVPTDDGARFAHALIREALYEGILPVRRRATHRRVAEALLAAPDPAPDAVADHLQRAGDSRAGEWLERAGERARRAYAWVTAAARYEAALALLEAGGGEAARRGWLAFRLAALRRYDDAPRALGYAAEAARLAAEAGDPLLTGVATFLTGMVRSYGARELPRAFAEMVAGLDALDALPAVARVPPGAAEPLDPGPRRGTLVAMLADMGRYAEARSLGERYLAGVVTPTPVDWLGGNPHADAHLGLAAAYTALGDPARAGPLFARARALNEAVGHHLQAAANVDEELLTLAMRYRADHPAGLWRLLAAEEEAFARAGGLLAARPSVGRLWLLILAGRWAEAHQLGATDVGGEAGWPALWRGLARGQLARHRGEHERAWAVVRAVFPDGPGGAPGESLFDPTPEVQRLAAALALDAGDLPAARAWLALHDRWLAWSGAVAGQAEGGLGWAAYHRAAGELAAAQHHAAQALAHAADPRQPLAVLAAHRLLGELATDAGRGADALAHLAAALALAEACAAPYERALTLLARADLHLATSERDGATAALAEARALLVPLEARPALARAAALEMRLAAAPVALPFGLTAREAEVLTLVAEGLPDAEVAARLFVSRATVSTHLRAIYGKLGVTSRTAAARVATDHGLA